LSSASKASRKHVALEHNLFFTYKKSIFVVFVTLIGRLFERYLLNVKAYY
jgi:hypothetical protein